MLLLIQHQIKNSLDKGLIHPSISPFGASMLLVQKKNKLYGMCVDYSALNRVILKYCYPITRIDFLDKLRGATFTLMNAPTTFSRLMNHIFLNY